MWKKLSGGTKLIGGSIPKHQVGGRKLGNEKEGQNHQKKSRKFLGGSKYSWLSDQCFKIIQVACEKLHLIGFTRQSNGEYVLVEGKVRIWHYAVLSWVLAVCIQKCSFMIEDLIYKELRVETFLSLILTSVQVNSIVLSAGVILRPKETIDVLNSWSYVAPCLKHVDPSFKFQPLGDTVAGLKVSSLLLVLQGLTAASALLNLAWSNLPVSLFPIVERFGLIPTGILPRFGWQMLFAPLEVLTFMLPSMMQTFSAAVVFIGNGVIQVYLQQLRKIRVHSLESRRTMEKMYVRLELLNGIFQAWFRFAIPTILFSGAIAVILFFFIFIRFTELNLFLWLFVGCSGVTVAFLLFGQSYEMILLARASEDILGDLCRHDVPYFGGMTRENRVALMKRAKAMRPVTFLLGDSQFSISVPITLWDEILNQILFLLTLL